jgi:calcium-dependent protein kinase
LKDLTISSGQFVKEGIGDLYSNYELCNYIGKGGFGRVYKVRHKLSNQYRAMKIIKCQPSSQNFLSTIQKEINVLKSLDHPNIIKVYEFYKTEKYIYIINELCTGGELFDRIVEAKHFSEIVACNVMRQLLSAIAYCHEKGIIHRDLKPENILIENSEEKNKDFFLIKVIDFGTCEILKKSKLTEQIGTSFYMAPEVLQNGYNEKCDLWSCGIILYILLSGSPPFYGKNEKEIFAKIINGNLSFKNKIWNKISEEAKSLVKKLLEINPEKRISATEALKEKWFEINKNPNDNKVNNNLPMFIQNITEFCAEQKLQQATLAFLVHNFAPKEELNELKEIFFAFDKNCDGKLSKEEFFTGLSNTNTLNTILKKGNSIEGLMKNIDADNNGYIGFEEFCVALINKEKILTETNLRMAFNVFDRDKSGGISQNELKYILGEYNVNAKDHLWKKMIEQIDLNRDGQISYEEFHKMMMDVINNKNKRLSMMQLKAFIANNQNINGISLSNIGNQFKSNANEENCKDNENNQLNKKKRNKSVFIYNKRNTLEEE